MKCSAGPIYVFFLVSQQKKKTLISDECRSAVRDEVYNNYVRPHVGTQRIKLGAHKLHPRPPVHILGVSVSPLSVPPWRSPTVTAAAIAAASVTATTTATRVATALLPLLLLLLVLAVAVHGREHEADVGGEQVVHLVAEGGLAEEPAAPDQVPDGHVEVV